MPWHDWQFWVVTLVALLAAGYLLRRVLPARWVGRGGKGARTSLTIEGKPAQRRGE